MSNEIVKSESAGHISFDEYKAEVLRRSRGENLFEKAADLYDRIPVYLRMLLNLVSSPIAPMVVEILSENRAERKEEAFLWAMYHLAQGIEQHTTKLEQLDVSYLRQELPRLTARYVEESAKTLFEEKVKIFRNIWVNGLLAADRSFSEKSIVFDIVGELTEDEIEVLSYFWKRTNEARGELVHISVSEVAEAMAVDEAYTQQLCVRLRRHGLVSDTTTGMTIGTGPPRTFAMMDFAETLVQYTLDPSSEGPG